MKIPEEFQLLLDKYLTKLLQPKSANFDVKTFVALVMMEISTVESQVLPSKLENLGQFLDKDADDVVRHILQLIDLIGTNPDGFRLHAMNFLDSKTKPDVPDTCHENKGVHRSSEMSSKYRKRGEVDHVGQRSHRADERNYEEQHYDNPRYDSSRYVDSHKGQYKVPAHRDSLKSSFDSNRHYGHKDFYDGQSDYDHDRAYDGQKVVKDSYDDYYHTHRNRHDRIRNGGSTREFFSREPMPIREHANSSSSSYKHSREPYFSRNGHSVRGELSRDAHLTRESHGSRSGGGGYSFRGNDSSYESHSSHNDPSRDSYRETHSRDRDRDRNHFASRGGGDSHSSHNRDYSHHDSVASSSGGGGNGSGHSHSGVDSEVKKNPAFNKPPAQPILFLSLVPQHLNDINFLNEHFRHYGKVVNIETRPRGHALIKFEKYSAADAALKSGISICGDPNIRISWWSAEMDRFGARQAAFSQVSSSSNSNAANTNHRVSSSGDHHHHHHRDSDYGKDRDSEKQKKASDQRDDEPKYVEKYTNTKEPEVLQGEKRNTNNDKNNSGSIGGDNTSSFNNDSCGGNGGNGSGKMQTADRAKKKLQNASEIPIKSDTNVHGNPMNSPSSSSHPPLSPQSVHS